MEQSVFQQGEKGVITRCIALLSLSLCTEKLWSLAHDGYWVAGDLLLRYCCLNDACMCYFFIYLPLKCWCVCVAAEKRVPRLCCLSEQC